MRNDKWDKNGGMLFPDPGVVDVAYCGICKEKMDVAKNVFAPTSWAEAMAGGKHKHDHFRCPNYNADWHRQIFDMKEEAFYTNDKNTKKRLEKEIKKILGTRKATRDMGDISPMIRRIQDKQKNKR